MPTLSFPGAASERVGFRISFGFRSSVFGFLSSFVIRHCEPQSLGPVVRRPCPSGFGLWTLDFGHWTALPSPPMTIAELLSNEDLRLRELPVARNKVFLAHAGDCPLPRRVSAVRPDVPVRESHCAPGRSACGRCPDRRQADRGARWPPAVFLFACRNIRR